MVAIAMTLVGAGPVWAAGQETARAKTVTAPQAEQKSAQPIDPLIGKMHSADNPYVKVVEQRARALVAPLSQTQMEQLYKIREAYGLIRSVEIVERDIKRAVKFCGEDNPEMKKEMDDKFTAWSAQVVPVLQERMKALQTAIDSQDFTAPQRIRAYFKALDDAAIYAEKKFDKRVITTAKACQSLQGSMGATAKQVAAHMADLKIPEFKPAAESQSVPAADKAE